MSTLTSSRDRRPALTRPGLNAPPLYARVLKGILLTAICATVIVPFMGIISTSLAPPDRVREEGGFVIIPTSIDFSAYEQIFNGGVVVRALAVSAGITIVGTLVALTVSCLFAYALSWSDATGTKTMLMLLLVSMLFSPGLIPNYLMVKQLGLLNSYWALILPVAMNAFNVIVLRAFFMGIPRELIDSARIDGAGYFQIFTRVVLPLSKAVLAVIGLFYAVAFWNAFFNALLYLSDTSMWPLQLVTRTFVVDNNQLGATELAGEVPPTQQGVQMAILMVTVLPILLVYPFLQRHFGKGMLTGAVKG